MAAPRVIPLLDEGLVLDEGLGNSAYWSAVTGTSLQTGRPAGQTGTVR